MPHRRKKDSAFERYAHEYDWMTNADQRRPNHAKEVAALIKRYRPDRVLDAGCATGLTSMLFAEAGVEAVGLDRSRPMLTEAKKKASGSGLAVSFRYGRFEKLPISLCEKFDLVVCLANSISGVETIPGLRQSVKGFHNVLKPGGALVLQLLNYAALKSGEVMPVKATCNEGIVYARHSIRRGKTLAIHLVRVDLNQTPPGNEAFVHEFENFTPEQVEAEVKRAGFKDLRRFGNLVMTRRFSKRARDLVLTGRK